MECSDLREFPVAAQRDEYKTSLGCLVRVRLNYFTGNVCIEHVTLSMEDFESKLQLCKVFVK